MSKMIFISLPVADLDRARGFYEALGFTHNPQFSDDAGACMVWSEAIFVMLLTHVKWRGFTTRPIAPAGSHEVSFALAFDSRADVDRIVEAGAAAGGSKDANPPEDHGFMYQRTVLDPDGHCWEPMWMDAAAAQAGPPDHQPAAAA